MKPQEIQHLYWRAGFGILPKPLHDLQKKSKKAVLNDLFFKSKNDSPLRIDTSEIDHLLTNKGKLSDDEKKKIQQYSRKKLIELNAAWIHRLGTTDAVLREKMTLFWANVFVCRDNNVAYMQRYNNTLRQHALGDFRAFVNAISKEAAMTKYLNTQQNKKQKPNENFARELMELFTLGEGHYTEQDIKESARAFTGYSHNLKGDFVLRRFQHDQGEKTFFGKTGNFNGEDIVDIILEQEQCARFISKKIYKYFVNDSIDENHVEAMTRVFYKDYNIANLMHFIFNSDWFYDAKHIGSKIKSPIEFMVGMNRLVPIQFSKPRQLLYIQKQLGQILLDPPNVAGWKGGRNWIDSNTIVLRLKLPSMLLNNAYISKAEVGEEDTMINVKKNVFKKGFGKRMDINCDWETFTKNFNSISINELQNYILAGAMNPDTKQYIEGLEKVSKKEYSIQLMSLPEYQMC
ncbi:DUF1800 domain-containing protein [Gaetbulibacter aestuarii]|uniref:DUF1800 domain-containing protein n=1 Tax=Gaetbulibacter aestuarii TaxID=1502358 RepID=A0ABW7MVD1_9FLAO